MKKRIALVSVLFFVATLTAVLLAPSSRNQLAACLDSAGGPASWFRDSWTDSPKGQAAGIGSPAGPEDIALLLEPLKGDDSLARNLAVAAIARIGPPAVSPLVNALNDSEPRVRLGAVGCLYSLAAQAESSPALRKTLKIEAIPPLMNCLKDEDRRVRVGACRALLTIGPDSIPALKRGLASADYHARYHAAVVLTQFGQSSNPVIRALASPIKDTIPMLTPALADPDGSVRAEALLCIAASGQEAKAVLPQVAEALNDPDVWVRTCAAEARKRINATDFECGVFAMEKENEDEAISWFTKALKTNPSDVESHMELARIHRNKHDYERALKHYSTVIRLNPKYEQALVMRGGIYLYDIKDVVSAESDYKKLIALRPRNSAWHNRLAWLLATYPRPEGRDGKEAIDHAKRACELSNNSPVFVETLAAAYAEAGDFEKAVQSQKKALASPRRFTSEELQLARKRLHMYENREPFRHSP
jgi:HEAT repeat protein